MNRVMRMLKTKYADFQGRARRKEFWYFVLFYAITLAVAAVIDGVLFGNPEEGPVQLVAVLALLCPMMAVAFRRFHDIDRSAWWILIGLIPIIGTLIVLYWEVQPGTKGSNRFGPDPIEQDEGAGDPAAAI